MKRNPDATCETCGYQVEPSVDSSTKVSCRRFPDPGFYFKDHWCWEHPDIELKEDGKVRLSELAKKHGFGPIPEKYRDVRYDRTHLPPLRDACEHEATVRKVEEPNLAKR